MSVSRQKTRLDTFISESIISEWREYQQFAQFNIQWCVGSPQTWFSNRYQQERLIIVKSLNLSKLNCDKSRFIDWNVFIHASFLLKDLL